MAELDRETLQDLRQTLEERARALREELRATAQRNDQEKAQLLRDEVRDNGDQSFVDLVTDVNLADVDRDLGEFRAVSAALSRMDSGQYGYCEDCGRPIALERLRAQPFASRCLQCQEQYEHLTNQTRTPTL